METTFHSSGVRIPKGIDISEPGKSGPVVEACTLANLQEDGVEQAETSLPWCYIFVHHSKVSAFIDCLDRDMITYFVHRTVVYLRKKQARKVRPVEKPTVSGLVFLQGTPQMLQAYLDLTFPGRHLVKNCSTHLPAVIPDSVMRPFMRVLDISPDRIRFLLHPFKYYAGNNVKLRIISGFLAGLEGYVIRIDRDRRLVMEVGGMSVAISGIHCEKFEVVKDNAET